MLKAKIANKVQIDNKGYCHGEIISIIEIEDRVEKIGKKDVRYAAQFEINIISQGSIKPISHKIWMGQNINSQKFENSDGKNDYNRLTRLLLNLGIIKESELPSLTDDAIPDMEKLEGLKIKFKLQPSNKNQQLSIIDLTTISLDK